MTLDRKERNALEWFRGRLWADRFGEGEPSLAVVKRLVDAGYVERMVVATAWGLTKFRITEAGRATLKDNRADARPTERSDRTREAPNSPSGSTPLADGKEG